jgi:hypothetical protein
MYATEMTSVPHDIQIPVTMKRLLDSDSLQALARGCGVLGAGGGGDVHYCLLQALQASEDYGPVPLVDVGGNRLPPGQHREVRERR